VESYAIWAVILRYLIQALDSVIPNLPSYSKVAAAGVLSYASVTLGSVHAPQAVQQSLPGVSPFLSGVLLWGLTDAAHSIINVFEKWGGGKT
jgi:hypothetical protein